MKNSIIASLLIASFQLNSQCQNLVPNPSFEDTIKCPQMVSTGTCSGFFYDAFADCVPPWYLPTCATADYFNQCASWVVGVPTNSLGYQAARTGDAYAGMIVYDSNGEWREYIATPLTQPLQSGKTYLVEFYVNLSDDWYAAIDSIGLYFSTGSIDTSGVNWWALPYTPHVSSPSGNFLSDSINWKLISGTYVAAGGEDHITIGNFSNDANTAVNLPAFKSYYYIDDVLVMEDTTSGIEEKRIRTIEIYPNPVKDELTVQLAEGNWQYATFELYDVMGRRVKQLAINKKQLTIDVSELPAGLYIWSIGNARGKVVVDN